MSPSISNNKNKWKLPTNPAPSGVRCICVPVPNDPEWIGKFYGQLWMLAQQIWWDRDEAHTAKVIAARWQEVVLATLEGDCMADDCDDCLGRLVYDPATGRLAWNGDIGFFRVPDGDWVDSPTEPTYPPPQPYDGPESDDEKRCIASRNAALVIGEFYRQTVGVLAEPVINVVLALIESAAEYVSRLLNGGLAIDLLIAAAKEVIEDQLLFDAAWTPDETTDLQNILYCASSITDDVVTFNFSEVVSEMTSSLITQFNAASILVIHYLGEDGLNTAGGIHNEDEADCSSAPCVTEFCRFWNMGATDGGWVAQFSNSGNWVSAQGWIAEFFNSSSQRYLDLRLTFTDTYVRTMTFGYDKSGGAGANNSTLIRWWSNGVQVGSNTANPIGVDIFRTIDVNASIDRIDFIINSGTAVPIVALESFQVDGDLPNGFVGGVVC